MCKGITELVADGPKDVDILNWMSRAALEYIAQAGLGHTFDLITSTSDVESFNPMVDAIKSLV